MGEAHRAEGGAVGLWNAIVRFLRRRETHIAILMALGWVTSLYAVDSHPRWPGDHENKLAKDIRAQTVASSVRHESSQPGEDASKDIPWKGIWKRCRYWNNGLISTAGDSLVLSPLIHLSLSISGVGAGGYRLPNAFLTWLMIPLVYILARMWYSPSVAFIGTFFLVLSPAFAIYARLAHYVGATTTVLLLMFLSAAKVNLGHRRIWWAALGLSLVLMPYFYSTIRYLFLLLIPLVLHAFWGWAHILRQDGRRCLCAGWRWLHGLAETVFGPSGGQVRQNPNMRRSRMLAYLAGRHAGWELRRRRALRRKHGWCALLCVAAVLAISWPNLVHLCRGVGPVRGLQRFYYARGETVMDMLDRYEWVEFTLGYRVPRNQIPEYKWKVFWSILEQRGREVGNAFAGVFQHDTFLGHWARNAEVFVFWMLPAFWLGIFSLFVKVRESKSVFVLSWIVLSILPLLFTTRFHAARVFVSFPAICLAAALGIVWVADGLRCGIRKGTQRLEDWLARGIARGPAIGYVTACRGIATGIIVLLVVGVVGYTGLVGLESTFKSYGGILRVLRDIGVMAHIVPSSM
jgi:hypothetical protein